jgi:hypothetical protein
MDSCRLSSVCFTNINFNVHLAGMPISNLEVHVYTGLKQTIMHEGVCVCVCVCMTSKGGRNRFPILWGEGGA